MIKSEYLFTLLESVDPKLVHLAKKAALAARELEASHDAAGKAPRGKKVKATLSYRKFDTYARGLAMHDQSIIDIYRKAYREAGREVRNEPSK